jgi:CRP/FNR family transcriptional regulator, dissimilatory nitrate respiration regulator
MPHDPHRHAPPTLHDLATTLRSATIFSRCSDPRLQTLARRTRLVHLDAGEVLFQRGQKAGAVYLLVHGQLKLYRTSPDGNEVIVDLVDAGSTFAETRAFLGDPHFHLSCAALVNSQVAAVDLAAFLALLHDSVDTCLLLLQRISERAERHIDDIERLALQGGTCRVASYLLGQLPPGRSEYRLTVTKGVLATRLGLRAETLSRVLKQLGAEGIVSVSSGNIVHIPNRQKLRRFIEEAGKV